MKYLSKLFVATVCLSTSLAFAAYPDKPIKLIIGFPAGGPLDQHARLLADKLQAVLGQPLIVDYKSGAGGVVGAESVAKSAPDGYTVMLANTGVMVINEALYSKLPYNLDKDLTPVTVFPSGPLVVGINDKIPANAAPPKLISNMEHPSRHQPSRLGVRTLAGTGQSHYNVHMYCWRRQSGSCRLNRNSQFLRDARGSR